MCDVTSSVGTSTFRANGRLATKDHVAHSQGGNVYRSASQRVGGQDVEAPVSVPREPM